MGGIMRPPKERGFPTYLGVLKRVGLFFKKTPTFLGGCGVIPISAGGL